MARYHAGDRRDSHGPTIVASSPRIATGAFVGRIRAACGLCRVRPASILPGMRVPTIALTPIVLLVACSGPPEPAPAATPAAAAVEVAPATAKEEAPEPAPPMNKAVTLACPAGAKQVTRTLERGGRRVAKVECRDTRGILQGPYVEFDDRGAVAEESSYVDGTLDGKWTKYRFNGEIDQQGQYERGVMRGKWREYYGPGEVDSEVDYIDNNNFTMTAYNEDGTLKARGKTVDGRSDGEWTWYDGAGKPEHTVVYELWREVKAWAYRGEKRVPAPVDSASP
jgi:hypothetical protein